MSTGKTAGGQAAEPAMTAPEQTELAWAAEFETAFGLGPLEQVTRERVLPGYARAGGCFGGAVFSIGVAALLATAIATHPARSAWPALLAVMAVLLAPGWVLFGVGRLRSKDFKRVYCHAGGLALLLPGEPEPRVARWPDISTFTLCYQSNDDAASHLLGFAAVTASRTELPASPLGSRRRERRALVAAALSHLEPLLGPALAETYRSAGAVAFGDVTLERSGLYVPGVALPWAAIRSARVTKIASADGGYPEEIIIRPHRGRTVTIALSGRPNGVFLPGLLAWAAAPYGVKVTGHGGILAR